MPGGGSFEKKAGGKDAGFHITYSPKESMLTVLAWGFWPPDLVSAFSRDASDACRELFDPLSVVMDATELKPQGTEGQKAIKAFLDCLKPSMMSGVTILVSNILTRLQLTRIVKESAVGSLVQFKNESARAPLSASNPWEGGPKNGKW